MVVVEPTHSNRLNTVDVALGHSRDCSGSDRTESCERGLVSKRLDKLQVSIIRFNCNMMVFTMHDVAICSNMHLENMEFFSLGD